MHQGAHPGWSSYHQPPEFGKLCPKGPSTIIVGILAPKVYTLLGPFGYVRELLLRIQRFEELGLRLRVDDFRVLGLGLMFRILGFTALGCGLITE